MKKIFFLLVLLISVLINAKRFSFELSLNNYFFTDYKYYEILSYQKNKFNLSLKYSIDIFKRLKIDVNPNINLYNHYISKYDTILGISSEEKNENTFLYNLKTRVYLHTGNKKTGFYGEFGFVFNIVYYEDMSRLFFTNFNNALDFLESITVDFFLRSNEYMSFEYHSGERYYQTLFIFKDNFIFGFWAYWHFILCFESCGDWEKYNPLSYGILFGYKTKIFGLFLLYNFKYSHPINIRIGVEL